MRRECRERFPPPPRFSDPDMHPGTCVTHVPWCMSGSLTSSFLKKSVAGKTFPAFPAHAQSAILRIWQEAHGFKLMFCQFISISVRRHYLAVSCSQQSTVMDPIKMKIENVTKYKNRRISNHSLLCMIHWGNNAVQTSKMSQMYMSATDVVSSRFLPETIYF